MARINASLQTSESKYRALVETTNTGYLIMGADGTIIETNDYAAGITGGNTPEQIRGRQQGDQPDHHRPNPQKRELEQ